MVRRARASWNVIEGQDDYRSRCDDSCGSAFAGCWCWWRFARSGWGLLFSERESKRGRIQMHYLTPTADAKTKAVELWRPLGLLSKESAPMLREVEPGVIRLDVEIGKLPAEKWIFHILGLIGHLVFV